MSQGQAQSGDGLDIYRSLPGQDPAARREAVLRLVQEHPQRRLELPARDGLRAMLNEIDLTYQAVRPLSGGADSPAPWWNPEFQTADLKGADLRGASLRRARLEGVRLEVANFAGADLAGAHLGGAVLSEADLTG